MASADFNMVKHCIACNSGKFLSLYQKNCFLGYAALECSKCGLIFFECSDNAAKRKLDEYYRSEYWNTVRKKWDKKQQFLIPVIKFLRALKTEPLQQSWHYSLIRRFVDKKNTRFLDVGCGRGDFLAYFYQKGFDVTGIEPDKANAEAVNRRFGKRVCINSSVENMRLNEKFDVVYLCHVFEHFIRPDIFLDSIRKSIASTGILFIEIPNGENKRILPNSLNNHPHFFNFTLRSVKKLFESKRYEVLHAAAYAEKKKDNLSKFSAMLAKTINYRQENPKTADRIIVIARPQ